MPKIIISVLFKEINNKIVGRVTLNLPVVVPLNFMNEVFAEVCFFAFPSKNQRSNTLEDFGGLELLSKAIITENGYRIQLSGVPDCEKTRITTERIGSLG